jgi:hypothetical protein
VPVGQRLGKRWWRWALTVVTLVMAAFSWYDPIVAVFTVIPVVIWCWGLARSDKTGLVYGLILTGLAAWTLLPRGLGFSGRWVPSVFEVCVFLPILTAVICAIGMRVERVDGCLPAMGLSAYAVVGLIVAFFTLLSYAEGTTGDEGVWPGPSGLQVVEGEKNCGSGGCWRTLDATGDRAPERMRDYLASRGFSTPGFDNGSICRVTGLALTYKICATVKDISPATVRVTWSI